MHSLRDIDLTLPLLNLHNCRTIVARLLSKCNLTKYHYVQRKVLLQGRDPPKQAQEQNAVSRDLPASRFRLKLVLRGAAFSQHQYYG